MSDVVGYLLNYGALGIMCFLLVLGLLVPKPSVDDLKDDRDMWRSAYETEAAAHAATREALKDSTERADAAVETAKVANALLTSLGHKDGT